MFFIYTFGYLPKIFSNLSVKVHLQHADIQVVCESSQQEQQLVPPDNLYITLNSMYIATIAANIINVIFNPFFMFYLPLKTSIVLCQIVKFSSEQPQGNSTIIPCGSFPQHS